MSFLGSLAAALTSGALVACGSDVSPSSFAPDTVHVAASFYPIEEIVRSVGGTAVSILGLVPAGESAHDYEPTPRQFDDLQSADIVFFLGGGFQPNVEKAVATLPDRIVKVDLLSAVTLVSVSEQLAGTDGETDGEVLNDGNDPHVWLSPLNMQRMADMVKAVLLDIAGVDREIIASSAANYSATLGKLHADFVAGLSNCSSKVIVTSHRAFGYLASEYGLQQLAIAGISPSDEPSAKTLEAVANAATRHHVTTIFFENNLPADLSRTIAGEVGATTDVLDPVESLSREQLADGADYVSIMEMNLAALMKGLGCS